MSKPGPVIVIGSDSVGTVASQDGMRYYLTPCCSASAKGGGSGVICRACYQPVDEALGGLPQQTPEWAFQSQMGVNYGPEISLFTAPLSHEAYVVMAKAGVWA